MPPDWSTIISVLAALSPILLVIIGGIGWLYRHEKERREAVERQLSEHKYKTYITLLDLFFDVMKATKTGKTIDQNDLNDRMFNAGKDLIIYGSDDVVTAFQKWLGGTREGKVTLGQFGELVISVRQDMGNSKTNITSEDVLRQFIIDYDDAKEKGLI
jgi:hypothetical protein